MRGNVPEELFRIRDFPAGERTVVRGKIANSRPNTALSVMDNQDARKLSPSGKAFHYHALDRSRRHPSLVVPHNRVADCSREAFARTGIGDPGSLRGVGQEPAFDQNCGQSIFS
jgi:hypothetical protein